MMLVLTCYFRDFLSVELTWTEIAEKVEQLYRSKGSHRYTRQSRSQELNKIALHNKLFIRLSYLYTSEKWESSRNQFASLYNVQCGKANLHSSYVQHGRQFLRRLRLA